MIAVLAMAVSFIALQSCNDSDPDSENNSGGDQTQWGELKSNVVALPEDAAQYVESYESDSIIQFSASTPADLIPEVGTIIFVPQSDNTPFGYLGKITRIETSDGFKVFTETAPLDEVFGNLSVDGSIESIDAIEEVTDAEGNPVEYEIVDSLFQETGKPMAAKTRTGDFYLKDKLIKFPFKIYKGESGKKSINISGHAYAGFKHFSLSIDINDNKTSYVDLNLTPCIGVKANSKVKLAGGKLEEKDILIGHVTFRATIVTPAGIPIIIPIKFYVYGTCGISGELNATLTFKPEYSTNWNIRYKNNQWTCEKKDAPTKNPWLASEFEVKGEIYSGTKIGVMVCLYSTTVGVGINVIPKYSLGCSASIKSEDILNINPMVDQTLKISSEAYCAAKFFGKTLAKASFQFPDYILWNEKIYLLPQYSDFSAIGNGSHGEINYKIDQHYFLNFLGFRHGVTVFDSDGTTNLETAYPAANKTDNRGYTYHSYTTNELKGGRSYYAAPAIYGLGRLFHGEKHRFSTEASYHLDFRCTNQSYDVVSFSFSLNDLSGNKLDYTTDATDYDGDALCVHITGEYNASNNTLSGNFDIYSYDDPEQRRTDGFSVDLSSGDSGYADCTKIVDNGGCYASVRIYNESSPRAKSRRYDKALDDDDCKIGLFNRNYK